jgi:hypothetical protein
MKYLCESLKSNSSLTHLYLSHNYIGDEGIKYLCEHLKLNSTLKQLCLNVNEIGDEGIKYLSESLKLNSSLKELDLNVNKIGDEGIKCLSESLILNSTLTTIELSHNKIGDEGIKYLNEFLKSNSTLTKINLDHKIDKKTIEYLLKCNQKWSTKIHHDCSSFFKQAVHTFLFYMKCNQMQTGLKIPKFVLFEIIKFIDQKSFISLDLPTSKHNNKRKRNDD